MKYNMKRVLSAALLLAFTAMPSTMAASTYGAYNSYDSYDSTPSSMSLNNSSKLTDRNDKITLSLRDSDVKQVLRMFADKAGKNIVFHTSVAGKITLDLVDMPINDAYNLVLQVAGLNTYTQGNTLVVVAKGSADNAAFSHQDMMLFPVSYVSASKIADFLNNNVFNNGSGEVATVNAATNDIIVFGRPSDRGIVEKVITQLDREPLTRVFSVSHTTPAEMADMICNMLLPARGATPGMGNAGGNSYAPPTPGIGTGGAAGIVTGGASSSRSASGDELKLGEGVVACTVSQTAATKGNAPFDLQNLAVSYYPQRGTIMIMGGSEAQANMIERFIKANDTKQPQAYLEISIVELTESGMKAFNNDWSINTKHLGFTFKDGSTGGSVENVPHGTTREYIQLVEKVPGEDGADDTLRNILRPREAYYAHGPYVKWTMSYLVENGKARVLANPKLLITNGQESVLDLTSDYVEKVTSEFLSSTGAGYGAIGAVQRTYSIGEDKGIKVTLTPFISPEGYITMNIKPEYAVEAGTVTTPNEAGGTDIAATLLNRRNLDLKNVRIKDGETLVIGGLIQEGETKTVKKIPVLGDLPVIGTIFRSTNTAKAKSELVIMLTPKIINDGEGSVADNL